MKIDIVSLNKQSEIDGFLARAWHSLEMAFQPIVNNQSGHIYGYEALMRGQKNLGFDTISQVLEHARENKIADKLYLMLLEKSLMKLKSLNNCQTYKLFYNLDGRALEQNPNLHEETYKLLKKYHIAPQSLILEFSETFNYTSAAYFSKMVANHRKYGINFAIDDFGRGYSELQLIYDFRPEIIKIDRYFVSGMVTDNRKRLFVSNIINLAHVLGIRVVVEGVETVEEYELSWQLGGDLIQGFFVARPSLSPADYGEGFKNIHTLVKHQAKTIKETNNIVDERIEKFKTLGINSSLDEVFEAFRYSKNQTVFPILSEQGEPKGIILEREMKEYTYSPYGRDLLKNTNFSKGLSEFIRKCPILDRNATTEEILGVSTYDEGSKGIIITENDKYYGFLSSRALLSITNDKRLNAALDKNPLSKLPGNITISEHIETCLQSGTDSHHICYLDFDNFKPFNDNYGFKEGDRTIMMFAELLRETFSNRCDLIGHIGGDDFFLSLKNHDPDELLHTLTELRNSFARNAESLYNYRDRTQGYIFAKDRSGTPKKFPLLSVSIGVLKVSSDNQDFSDYDSLIRHVTVLKKKAKSSISGIYFQGHTAAAAPPPSVTPTPTLIAAM